MSGYLDNFGVSEARRERKVKRVVQVLLALLVGGFGAYVFLHDFQERRQVSKFIDLMREGNHNEAYRLWGCDPAKPCRDYNMARFLEDWGPKSPHADFSKVHVRRSRSCGNGLIQILEFSPGDEIPIYIDRQQHSLSFSPYDYCVDASGRNTKLIDIFFR